MATRQLLQTEYRTFLNPLLGVSFLQIDDCRQPRYCGDVLVDVRIYFTNGRQAKTEHRVKIVNGRADHPIKVGGLGERVLRTNVVIQWAHRPVNRNVYALVILGDPDDNRMKGDVGKIKQLLKRFRFWYTSIEGKRANELSYMAFRNQIQGFTNRVTARDFMIVWYVGHAGGTWTIGDQHVSPNELLPLLFPPGRSVPMETVIIADACQQVTFAQRVSTWFQAHRNRWAGSAGVAFYYGSQVASQLDISIFGSIYLQYLLREFGKVSVNPGDETLKNWQKFTYALSLSHEGVTIKWRWGFARVVQQPGVVRLFGTH